MLFFLLLNVFRYLFLPGLFLIFKQTNKKNKQTSSPLVLIMSNFYFVLLIVLL